MHCLEAWFFWKHALVSMSVEQNIYRCICFLLIFVFWYSPLCFDIQWLDRNGWIELIGLKWLSCNVRIGNRHDHNVGISTRDFEKGSRVEGPWLHQKEGTNPAHMRQTAFFARRSIERLSLVAGSHTPPHRRTCPYSIISYNIYIVGKWLNEYEVK